MQFRAVNDQAVNESITSEQKVNRRQRRQMTPNDANDAEDAYL